MNVLHARWRSAADSRVHFWIESDIGIFKKGSTRSGARDSDRVPVHPFAADKAVLPELLRKIHPALTAGTRPSVLTLRLPARHSEPVPSHSTDSETATGFSAWQADALSLDMDAACGLAAAACSYKGGDLQPGASVLFLFRLMPLADRIIERHGWIVRGVRDKQTDEADYFASWSVHPRLMEDLLESLTPAVPPVFCETSPSLAVSEVLNRLIDLKLRRKVSGRSEFLKNENEIPAFDAWLKALAGNTNRIESPAHEIEPLLQDAMRVYGYEETQVFRVCFRLTEPSGGSDLWPLQFLFQSTENHSVFFALKQVWCGDANVLAVLTRDFPGFRQEFLKKGMQAAAVVPALRKAFLRPDPDGVELTVSEAYVFLTEQSLLLKARGFGVFLPAWWYDKKTRLQMRLSLKSPAESSGAGPDALLDYEWSALCGGHELALSELEKLIEKRTPLVRLYGQWVEIRLQEIENAARYFKATGGENKSRRQIRAAEALRMAAEQDLTEVGLPLGEIRADGWVKSLLDHLQSSDKLTLIETPQDFSGRLRPYQQRGFSWLVYLARWGFGACLADDMGLGKTVQVIAYLLYARAEKRGCHLLICPLSVLGNWQKELERFAPSLAVHIHHGSGRSDAAGLHEVVSSADIVLTTYSLALRDAEILKTVVWKSLILDEAQNIKNEAAGQTRAVKNITADFRAALTGTPVENRLTDLWSLMDFLNPGYLGNPEIFKTRFIKPIEEKRNTAKAGALQHMIRPFLLRRLKTDKNIICDLPEKMEMKTYCRMTEEQADLYEAALRQCFEQIRAAEGIQRRGLIFKALTELKQICNHPDLYLGQAEGGAGRSGKTERLLEMTAEVLAEGDKALVFTQYVEMGHMLGAMFREAFGRAVCFLHGGSSRSERDTMIEDFQNSTEPGLFILSTKAGGTGLNLTAANHVFHFDRWWNPAVENQATDRAYRIGQAKTVQVHKFLCLGTLEEKIDAMIERKKELAGRIIPAGEEFLTELSDEELQAILKLERGGIYEPVR